MESLSVVGLQSKQNSKNGSKNEVLEKNYGKNEVFERGKKWKFDVFDFSRVIMIIKVTLLSSCFHCQKNKNRNT